MKLFKNCGEQTKKSEDFVKPGLPRSVKSKGKTKFFQGQGKVSEFCIWSGKFRIQGKVGEVFIILGIMSTKS